MKKVTLPKQARVVVMGGGIIGTSVAYHLGQLGIRDTVLLERDQLTSGTTWHAAGLMVTFGSTSETSTSIRRYTRELYARLEAETGQATGFMPVGFIEVASEPERLEEFRRIAAFNRYCGVEVEEISPREVARLFPLAKTEDLLAGFYVPKDGRVNPVDVTMALAKGARQKGVTLLEGVTVEKVKTHRNSVVGVSTSHGDIACDVVVNCAGMWARQLAARNGVHVPLQAAEHYYVITEAISQMSKTWPVLEDPSSYGYYREEGGGLMIGLFEPVCAPWKLEGVPNSFSFGEIPPDVERMGPYVEKAMSRVPISLETGVKKFFCGPESFTPDLKPVFGEAPEVRNYFVAAGLNSIGILTGGGLGRVMAHWIANGRPDVDITGMNIERLGAFQTTPRYRKLRTVESLGMVYQSHAPFRTLQSARGAKRSPLHDRLIQQGAQFRDVSGWEGADFYSREAAHAEPYLGWSRPPWFSQWAKEHHAARNNVILMDMSFMSKFWVEGRDAGGMLNFLSTNQVDGASGRITYTTWLNEKGLLEADLTVTKLNDEQFLVVASDTLHRHVATWLKRRIPEEKRAFVSDVTSGWAQINIQGPHARALMEQVSSCDFSNEAFPFRGAQFIDIGLARVLCVRITYLGELGYELYIPTEQAVHVYEELIAAGRAFDLQHAGLKALASLRMEKGYRDYGHDIDNTDNVWEAGLGFTVDLKKPMGFVGKDAALALKEKGPLSRRLVQIQLIDPNAFLFHAEVVYRNDEPVGYVRSASYGHTLGGAVGLVMVEAKSGAVDEAFLSQGQWEVDVAGTRFLARVSAKPLYDPDSKRVRG